MKRWLVREYMTVNPYSIGAEQTLDVAHDLMHKHGIRHLPVLHGGKLSGILSIHDLHLIETLPDVDPTRVRVEEAMTQELYTVTPDESLKEVAQEMARRKLGSAVVVEKSKVIGMFTTVDALRALAEAL